MGVERRVPDSSPGLIPWEVGRTPPACGCSFRERGGPLGRRSRRDRGVHSPVMRNSIAYERVNPETDLAPVTRLLIHAFAGTPEGLQEWLKLAGTENLRVVRSSPGAPPDACLLRIEMGQYFGGRSVRMLGIAGVAVGPEARGRGLARSMMSRAVQEAAADGFALSALYPSTQSLYRQTGYEQAGHRLLVHVPLAAIDVRERGGAIQVLGENDWDEVKAAYRAYAPRFNGMLDRGPYIWSRIPKSRDVVYNGFAVRGPGGAIDGYLFMNQKRRPDARQEITLSDFAFSTPEAGRRLLGFLADFSTMGDEVIFPAGPSHPALMLLAQQKYRMEFNYYWMLRIVDVRQAFEQRGYAPGISAELHLDIVDDLIPANTGRLVVRVHEGRAAVEPGGRGDLKADIRGLAPLYTGHLSAIGLAVAGLASGPEAVLRTADSVFGAGTPWMTDFF